ncbi:hypothetical protein AA0119_g13065 [Alternaria tenuissima]|uniref:Uncharacterized protein n=1 Tax=Alternaria tenuissima TaxID=119927 RepID=A0ABY0FPJ7_9PLEO|nr:hypothetical protein AA0119_g13065 [Alternaria tenuissima]RYO03541.1 hypothetical protein AA0121_g13070 [Alternaria tenuissima]
MSDVELTPEDCATIWNSIPEEFRCLPEGAHPPSTFVELLEALRHFVCCRHPQEAAQALGLAEETDWETSLEKVRGLVEHRCPVTTLIPETRSRLFKVSDVPVFANTGDYEGFRSSLLRFFQSGDAPLPHDYERALLRVLISFKDPIAHEVALTWDVTPFIRDDWISTYTVFVAFLDSKFQSITIETDILEEYMGTENDETFYSHALLQAATDRIMEIRRRPKYETLP